jgi:hypothetical protein
VTVVTSIHGSSHSGKNFIGVHVRYNRDQITWSVERQRLVNLLTISVPFFGNGYARNNGRIVEHGVFYAVRATAERMLHKDYGRKDSVAKSKSMVVILEGLAPRRLAVNRQR